MVLQLGVSKATAGALLIAGLTATAGTAVIASPQLHAAATRSIQALWPNKQVQYVHTRNAADQLLRAEYAFWHRQLVLLRKDAHTPAQRELIEMKVRKLRAARADSMAQLTAALNSCFGNQAEPAKTRDTTPTNNGNASAPRHLDAATAKPSDVGMPSTWAALNAGQKSCPAARRVVDAAWTNFKAIYAEAAAAVPATKSDTAPNPAAAG